MNFDLTQSLEILRRTPDVLGAMLDGVDDQWARATEGPDTFSPFDVVGHLISGEEADWMVRARLILARGESIRFEPFDRYRHVQRDAGASLAALLERFATLRAQNIDELRSWNLGERELDLPGEHPALGPVTLRQLLATWVVHDLGHVAQISRVMAKRYRDDVGPWAQYLPVLSDRPRPAS